MNLRAVDLNLLVVLKTLLEERHVSRTAELLHMSQPAVSRALQRLRGTLNDPLLVRSPQGFDLSSRAEALLPRLKQWLDEAETMVSEPVFDPATSRQTVRFYGPDPDIGLFLPPLFSRLRQMAPGMVMEVRSDPRDHFELLQSGQIHFALTPFEPASHTGSIHRLTLKVFDFAVVMSAANPLARGELSLSRYAAATHGLVSLTGRGGSLLERDLKEAGHLGPDESLKTAVQLSSFSSVASFVESSDVIFHLPKDFALEIAKGRDLVVRDDPPGMTVDHAALYLYWHERFHRDPMCVWIRRQLREIAGLDAKD